MRIVAPTFTQTPNDLFDHWLPLLNESELKVLLVILRKTFGWNKIRDHISTSQLVQLTGQSRRAVIYATQSLQDKGLVLKELVGKEGLQEAYYELVVDDNSNKSYPCNERTGGGATNAPGGVQQMHPQNKELKKEEKQQQQTCCTEPAAVSFSKSIPELESLDIPDSDKQWLAKNYKPKEIVEAIGWATHPSVSLSKSLAAAIKWACKEKPKVPETQQDTIEKNKKYAQELQKNHEGRLDGHQINALSKYIEITCYPYEFCLEYEENGFKEQLDSELRKRNIIKSQKE
jgi:phage replication O-like protein O